MTRALTTAEQAGVDAERNRVAWNLPPHGARPTSETTGVVNRLERDVQEAISPDPRAADEREDEGAADGRNHTPS